MANFLQFYMSGGLFMHLITACVGAAVASVVFDGRRSKSEEHAGAPSLRLADRLAWLAVGLGLLGSLFGCMELCGALLTVDPEHTFQATLRGGALVPVTLAWGLLSALPVWLATTIRDHRRARTR